VNKTYVITLTLEVDDRSDEQLQSVEGVKAEVESWLECLHGKVHYVTVMETKDLPPEGDRCSSDQRQSKL